MSRTDLTDDQLAARIRTACETQTEHLAVDDRPFVADASPPAGLPLAPARVGRHRLVLAAAAVVVVGAILVGVVLLRPDGSDEVRTAATPAPGASAGDWLAPSEAPFGLPVQRVDWSRDPDPTGIRGQLFAAAGGGRVFLILQPSAGDSVGDAGPTVRGHPTKLLPAKSGDGQRLAWVDGDTAIDAEYVGMPEADAVALVDRLVPRSAHPLDGFEPAAEGEVTLVAEAEPWQPTHRASVEYAEPLAPKMGRSVRVTTSTFEVPTVGQLESQLVLGPAPEDPPAESVRHYDEASGTFEVRGPGRSVTVQAGDGDATEAQLSEIADSVAPIDEAGLQALRRQAAGDPSGSDPSVTTSAPAATTTTAPQATVTTPGVGDPSSSSSEPLHVPVYRLDGTETTLAELADGRLAIVLLWQPSCTPCIKALQALDEVAAAHPDAAVVAVAVQASTDEVEAFAAEHGIETALVADPIGAVSSGWAVEGLPTAKVVSTEGEVVGSGLGGLEDFEEIDGFVREVLGS